MTHAVEVRNISVSYGQQTVVQHVDFAVGTGRRVAIIGPNGAGKSTLLRAILGLIPITQGEVRIFGAPFAQQRSRVAYVPQREQIDWNFPLSVRDVVLMGTYARMRWWQRPGKPQQEQAMEALAQVGMEAYADRHIRSLSGGQQQRVFLARALVQKASVIFLDEPFAGVDAATEQAIVQQLALLRDQGCTLLMVHHDLNTVRDYFDDVLLLCRSLIAFGPVEQAFTSETIAQTYGSSWQPPKLERAMTATLGSSWMRPKTVL